MITKKDIAAGGGLVALVGGLGWAVLSGPAETVPVSVEYPEQAVLVDTANVLTEEESAVLQLNIAQINDLDAYDLAVAFIPTTGELSIEEYTASLATEWEFGAVEENNDVLLLLAVNDLNLRLHVGNGARAFFSEEELETIMANCLIPSITENGWYEGVATFLGCLTIE